MTMAISRGTTLSSALDGLHHIYDGMRRRVAQIKARRAAYNRTFTELNVLSDRELSDIGIAAGVSRAWRARSPTASRRRSGAKEWCSRT